MEHLIDAYIWVAEFTGPIFGYAYATLIFIGLPIGFIIGKIFSK